MSILIAGITLALFLYSPMAFAASNVKAEGVITAYNGSAVTGLWAAQSDGNTGTIVCVFKNNGDLFVVTVKGSVTEGEELVISGYGYIAKNGQLLEEADGTSTISHDQAEIRVGKDVIVGQIKSFERADI